MTTIELDDQDRAVLAEMPAPIRRVLSAYRQAMADLGLPTHPDGKCPAPAPCPCSTSADAVEARAIELLNDPDAVPCLDCWVPLPLNVTSYAVDGGGVCGPCGIRRYGDHADEYLINEGYTDAEYRAAMAAPANQPRQYAPGENPFEPDHCESKSWTKQTITHHLFAHDRTFYFTSSDTKRALVESHRKMHER